MRIFLILFLFVFSSCSNNGNAFQVSNPTGYDLQKPIQVNLPLELDEISGLAYYTVDKTMFAISDEQGKLYKIQPFPSLKVTKWDFAKNDDFEDIVLKDSTFYIMASSGNLNVVHFSHDTILNNKIEFPFQGKMEFETLFYNPVIDRLEMMCKNCEDDKKKTITIFTFNTSTNQFADSPTVINVSSIFKEMNEKPFHIKASGAAIHPFTGDIYVLSSVNKLLVILDKYHQVKSSYPLNPKLFKQPEGITFSENGTLIISNESAKAGPANLLLFRYKK